MTPYNFGKQESDALFNLMRTLGWANDDKSVSYMDVIQGAHKRIFELTNIFTDLWMDKVISALTDAEREGLKIASSYFLDGPMPEGVLLPLVDKGLANFTGERTTLGNRVLDRLIATQQPTAEQLAADLETANSCLADYTKLFGDILTAKKIKREYQRMLKKELTDAAH